MDRHIIKCSDMDQMVYVISLLLETFPIAKQIDMGLHFTAEAGEHIIYIWGE